LKVPSSKNMERIKQEQDGSVRSSTCFGLHSCKTVDQLTIVRQDIQELTWPCSFVQSPIGDRLELSESSTTATRKSGIGRGVSFLGPLQVDQGKAYFEVEVVQIEGGKSQTMAIGVCCNLPAARPLIIERAKDLGQGSFLLGYDLPKVYAHGKEIGKIPSKEWRPLKELTVGDRVGLLVECLSMELTVFVNDVRKMSVNISNKEDPHEKLPSELWGVVDVHGTVKSIRVQKSPFDLQQSIAYVPPATANTSTRKGHNVDMHGKQENDEKGAHSSAVLKHIPSPCKALVSQQFVPRSGNVNSAHKTAFSQPHRPVHPCGCTVHLVGHNGVIVHVPQEDFVIGRNPKVANLTLDSPQVPNMISRKHARIVTYDDCIDVVDCQSMNGTWVNNKRVKRHKLTQGDVVVVGNPGHGLSPAEFRFSISLPAPEPPQTNDA